jgi:DNA-binding CsgD family transcriptional regulator
VGVPKEPSPPLAPVEVADQGLEQPPADFAAVFEKAPDPMLLLDDARALVAGNRRARDLLRVTAEKLRTLRVDDIAATPEGLDERWEKFRREGHQVGSIVVRAQDGTEHEVELRARADYEPGRHLAILRPLGHPRLKPGGKLSAREREVLRLLATGATATEIARMLFLSRATVATHVRNAMVKLGAHTRVEAVVIALRNGEIDV